MDSHEVVIKLRDLNPHLVCSLCAGYFVDATTITECLHTFCKSCIVKYLQSSKCCPTCNLKIHETQPLVNLQLDRTMHDIVLKVVPNLFKDEMRRRQEFYESRGLPDIKTHIASVPEEEKAKGCEDIVKKDFSGHRNSYRDDNLVSLCLERLGYVDEENMEESENEEENCQSSSPQQSVTKVIRKKYLRCSVRTMVLHLQRYLKVKLHVSNPNQIEIYCNDHIIHPCRTMKFIWITEWLDKKPPLVLHYNIKDQ
ncbi:polycomb group RING finger protein 1-like [Actinia tenebrosa]|uniref:Polycomb group RING finger protein 1-like n=1 Tax=Actinia tenebrosa TaxID=6105 RepID=A0A6P8I519_ACTTE|nr:polycomb group RING finger protein 1-like [Actinia tenebrosa]